MMNLMMNLYCNVPETKDNNIIHIAETNGPDNKIFAKLFNCRTCKTDEMCDVSRKVFSKEKVQILIGEVVF